MNNDNLTYIQDIIIEKFYNDIIINHGGYFEIDENGDVIAVYPSGNRFNLSDVYIPYLFNPYLF